MERQLLNSLLFHVQGFRTGYPYRVHSVRNELPRMKHDVEVPPAVSSFGYLIEEDELYKNR